MSRAFRRASAGGHWCSSATHSIEAPSICDGALMTEPEPGEPVEPDEDADVDDTVAAGDLDAEAAADAVLQEAAEIVEADLHSIVAERDDYLAALRRVQADFENFRKQTIRRNTELIERAAESLVEKLLPVLDACDGALAHGHDDVKPIYEALMSVLEKEGLTVVYPAGEPFDPTVHDAVMHEEGDDGEESESVVDEVLR